jgi:GFO/IDH/MocA oxidoreductase family protein
MTAVGIRHIRAAIVGPGLIGRIHAEAIQRAGAQVRAVVGRTEAAAAALRDEARAERATTDLSLALSDPDVDVVHICTPNVHHYPMAGRRWRPASTLCWKSLLRLRLPRGMKSSGKPIKVVGSMPSASTLGSIRWCRKSARGYAGVTSVRPFPSGLPSWKTACSSPPTGTGGSTPPLAVRRWRSRLLAVTCSISCLSSSATRSRRFARTSERFITAGRRGPGSARKWRWMGKRLHTCWSVSVAAAAESSRFRRPRPAGDTIMRSRWTAPGAPSPGGLPTATSCV